MSVPFFASLCLFPLSLCSNSLRRLCRVFAAKTTISYSVIRAVFSFLWTRIRPSPTLLLQKRMEMYKKETKKTPQLTRDPICQLCGTKGPNRRTGNRKQASQLVRVHYWLVCAPVFYLMKRSRGRPLASSLPLHSWLSFCR